jgi:hypothetical protein
VDADSWDGPGVHPGRVIATLARVLPPEAIITTDAGDFGTWAARGFRFHRPGTFLGSSAGPMGYGLPAAIGATLARPGRLGVALAGDGGFAMTMADMETAVRERAHVLAVVFDNGRYGTIWRHQHERGTDVGLGTQLGPVDFAAVAEACGALGIAVHSDEEFEPALRRALEAGRPALLHLALDPRWSTPDAGFAEIEIAPEVEVVGLEAELEPATTAPEAVQAAAVEAEAEGGAVEVEADAGGESTAEAEAETEPEEAETEPDEAETEPEAKIKPEPEAEPVAAADSDAVPPSD